MFPSSDRGYVLERGPTNSSGLFTAPMVSSPTSIRATAISQADASKSALATLTLNAVPILAARPTSLSCRTNWRSSHHAAQREHHKLRGLLLSASVEMYPPAFRLAPSVTELKAATYTGHLILAGGESMKIVKATLTVTSQGPTLPGKPVQTFMSSATACTTSMIARFFRLHDQWIGLQWSSRAIGNDLRLRCDRGGRLGACKRSFK